VELTQTRILHMSDLHLGVVETIPTVDPSVFLGQFLAEIIDRRIGIDACIITGDLAHGGEATAYKRLQLLLNSCPWPTRVLPGNHDDVQIGRQLMGSTYWPADDIWSWKIPGGTTLIGVSSVVRGFHHGEVGPESIGVIESYAKSAAADGPWVLALHHPPQDVGNWWMDAEGVLRGREDLLEVADKYSAAAILCGHVHMNAVVHRKTRVPVVVAPSIVHEVVFDDQTERPLRFRRRSPRALIHNITSNSLTSVELTTGGVTWLVEGKSWATEVERTNGRLPAQH
jgi:Icc protein